MGLWIICHEQPAQVPDRERMGRPIKRICRTCHGNRLLGDLRKIRDEDDKQRAELGKDGDAK